MKEQTQSIVATLPPKVKRVSETGLRKLTYLGFREALEEMSSPLPPPPCILNGTHPSAGSALT